jgi:hypothetical protein
MRQLLITLTIATMTTINSANAQPLSLTAIKAMEHQLDDVIN